MVALIPARGGSKGLPNKNIRSLNGKPLIVYTIQEALKAKNIDHVIVSTDSQEIADISIENGAEVPFLRPDSLATDDSIAIDTYIYTIERLEKEFGMNLSSFMVLLPTNPLKTANDLDMASELFYKKDADSVISFTEEDHPIDWHKRIGKDGAVQDIFDEAKLRNRQDYQKTHYPNGAIYIFKKDLIVTRQYYSKKTFAYIMPKSRSVDIDNLEEFEYAEYLIKKSNEK